MQSLLFPFLFLLLAGCRQKSIVDTLVNLPTGSPPAATRVRPENVSDQKSWAYFLQHLPEQAGKILDYRGRPVEDQHKHYRVLPFDVGTRDLQQCADALIRLRAEFLFAQRRFSEIRFRFTSGQEFAFADYCLGKRPVPGGRRVLFQTSAAAVAPSQTSLRRYLDLVYAYAGTISLWQQLPEAKGLHIGTVVITPGSPGHCFIITNKAETANGETVYKLVEGYSPAQSIYVLKNSEEPSLGCWHRLTNGTIRTASYTFTRYSLRRFE